MPQQLPDYLIGEKGVQLVPSPLHTPDGGLLVAKNVEFIRNQGLGGIGTRGGLARLNASALAGSVLALGNIPLAFPGELDLMVGLNAGETPTWKKTTDGTTYTDLTSSDLQRPAGAFTSLWGTATIPRDSRSASYKNQFYYIGDDYVVNTSAPPVVVYNGSASYEQFRVPTNPTSGGAVPRWISDFYIDNGVIYLGIYDPGGTAPDHKGRVLAYDPSNGTLLTIGNRFGNGSGENDAGFPFCLTTYLGQLWAGTYGVSGNNQGKVYRIQPGVDETWTEDLQATLHNGYYMSLCPYKGNLYAATDADSSGTAIIQKRTSTGTWSTSLSAPSSNVGFFCSMIVFNGELYAGYYKGTATTSTLIKKFDNSSWTTDKDVGADIAAFVPGKPFVFRDNLYWPFYDLTTDTGTSCFLLKRTTGGVWSSVLSGVGLRGALGQFAPAS